MSIVSANNGSPSKLPTDLIRDPFKFLQVFWPGRRFTDYQADIVESVASGVKTTMVPAANMLGKDYISAFIVIWFFSSRTPCRVVTSSVDHSQLHGVLWGEIRQWLDSAKYSLGIKQNDLLLRQVRSDGSICGISQVLGRVAQRGVKEGLLGRHVPRGPKGEARSLAVIDEASGFEDLHKDAMETWCHQLLVIGNCEDTENFFKRETEEGDLPHPDPGRPPLRKVIRIVAEQSPNVRLALKEIEAGKEPSHREVVPGCMSYDEYVFRRQNWDIKKQTIGLDAQFYTGEEVKLFPPEWLKLSRERADDLDYHNPPREAEAIGVDPAEGGDSTVWTVVDRMGVLDQISIKTSDTSTIHEKTLELIELWGVEPEQVLFDAGGGGRQHADLLRRLGHNVRTIAFGGTALPPERRIDPLTGQSYDLSSSREEYKNRRAQMYGELRNLINPQFFQVRKVQINNKPTRRVESNKREVFAISYRLVEVHRQMKPIPLTRDAEGRLYLIPKSPPTSRYKGPTLTKLLGHSPDELDSLALAVHGMLNPKRRKRPVFL